MANFGQLKRLDRNGALSKYYYVRATDGARRSWKSTKQTTLKGAKEQVKTWEVRDAKGERYKPTELPCDEALDDWLEIKKSRVSSGCYTVYACYARAWKDAFGKRLLRGLEATDVEKYLAGRETSARSRNNERNVMRMFFAHCIRAEWITRNPAEVVEKFRETKRKIRTLDEKEEGRLLEAAAKVGDQVYGFVLCLVQSGLRRGTVAAVEWGDIDFDRSEWSIPAGKMKSREDFTGRPIARDLMRWLRGRRSPAGVVFGPLDPGDWEAVIGLARLKGVKPHDLRRSFVTRCRRLAVPMETTMFLSDHRDVKVVLDAYREVDPGEAREAIEKVFGGA